MPTKEIAPGVLAVTELPEDAKNFTVIESHGYFPSPRIEHSVGGVDLPSGQWSIVGWSDELTEDQMVNVVPTKLPGYGFRNFDQPEYNGGSSPFDVWVSYSCKTISESFASLLRSHGITDRALIIKKEK